FPRRNMSWPTASSHTGRRRRRRIPPAFPGLPTRCCLRFVHAHVRGALSVALDRPRAALGRRLQIRRVSGRIRVEKPGLIVAPLPPFPADLEVDAGALRREIDYVVSDCRATMMVAAGVETQEYTYLSLEQRKALIRRTIECVDRRVPVTVGISHPSFKT